VLHQLPQHRAVSVTREQPHRQDGVHRQPCGQRPRALLACPGLPTGSWGGGSGARVRGGTFRRRQLAVGVPGLEVAAGCGRKRKSLGLYHCSAVGGWSTLGGLRVPGIRTSATACGDCVFSLPFYAKKER
jgi:hypothetical protein